MKEGRKVGSLEDWKFGRRWEVGQQMRSEKQGFNLKWGWGKTVAWESFQFMYKIFNNLRETTVTFLLAATLYFAAAWHEFTMRAIFYNFGSFNFGTGAASIFPASEVLDLY